MKRALPIILTLALTLPLCFSAFAAGSNTAPTTYLSENFDTVANFDALSFSWAQNTGDKATATVTDGRLVVDNLTGTADAILLLVNLPEGETLKDFTVSYDYTILEAANTGRYAGIMGYYQDPAHYAGCWIRANGTCNLEERQNDVYTAFGRSAVDLTTYGMSIGADVTYRVKICFHDGTADLYINDTLFALGNTALSLAESGKVALLCKTEIKVAIDNISVTGLDEADRRGYKPAQTDSLPIAAFLTEDNAITFDGVRGEDEGWSTEPTLTVSGSTAFSKKNPGVDSTLRTWLATDGMYLYIFMESSTQNSKLMEIYADFSNTSVTDEKTWLATDYDRFLDTADNGGNKSLWLQFDATGSQSGGPAYYEPRTVKVKATNKYGWTYIAAENSDQYWEMVDNAQSGTRSLEVRIPLGAPTIAALATGSCIIGFEGIGADNSWVRYQTTPEFEASGYCAAALRNVILPSANGSVTREAIPSLPEDLIRSPKAGQQLNPFAVIAEDAMYTQLSDSFVVWTDENGETAKKAEAGKTYTATLTLMVKSPITCFDVERTVIPDCYTATVSEDGSTVTLTRTWTLEAEVTSGTEEEPTTPATEEVPADTTGTTAAEPENKGCSSAIGSLAPLTALLVLGMLPLLRGKNKERKQK